MGSVQNRYGKHSFFAYTLSKFLVVFSPDNAEQIKMLLSEVQLMKILPLFILPLVYTN